MGPTRQDLIVEEDLPTSTIIIVAVVCGSVVIILTIILVVLCCRRYRTKQKYQKAEAARPPVMTQSNGGGGGAPLKPALRNGGSGMVNPGMDSTDAIDFDDQRNGVFATDTSHQLPPGYYNNSHPNGYISNGVPPQNWKNANTMSPPSYDNSVNDELNRRNRESYSSGGKAHKNINPREKNYLQLNDPYPHNHSKEGHKDTDSGVSTPDPQKPKKVIYEVVV